MFDFLFVGPFLPLRPGIPHFTSVSHGSTSFHNIPQLKPKNPFQPVPLVMSKGFGKSPDASKTNNNNKNNTKEKDFSHRELAIAFTCNKCETRNTKRFTAEAYYKGVVVVRCDGCDAKHLIADNLGYFDHLGDGRFNIEDIAREKGIDLEKVSDVGEFFERANEKKEKEKEKL